VYDGVGKDTWEENFEVVRKKGSIITYGNASGAVPAFEPLKLMPKCIKVSRPTLGVFIEEAEDFARYAKWIFDAIKEGGLKVSIL
jgi:NADPH2:quinone reductase